MADKVANPTEMVQKAVLKNCWKRFKQSRKVHKKRYFLATCLIKLGAFIGFMVVSGQKFDEFMDRPEYIAVCQYAVSEELALQVDYSYCSITVDQKLFTCDTEYGSNPTSVTYEQYYKDSEYSSIETAGSGYDTDNNTGNAADSGYDSGDAGDSSFDTSDTGNSSYDGGNEGDSGYDGGDGSYNSSYTGQSGYNSNSTAATGNNTGIADQNSSSSSESNIPPSGLSRRALSSSRSLQTSDYTTYYLYSDEADTASKFANDIKKGYLVFLYVLWVIFNFSFRVHSNLYTYRSRILQSIPRYSKAKKLQIAIYENLIDMCVATALYPFTYPEYGDCFECPVSFMCSIAMYAFVNIGFYIVLISILLIMIEKTRGEYIKFLKSLLEYVRCAAGRKVTGAQCIVRYFIIFLVICINLFAFAACIVVLIDYISTVYSVIQLFISIIFYFALFVDGDVREGQVAPAEQHALTQGNDDQFREYPYNNRNNEVFEPRSNANVQADQRPSNHPQNGNNLRRKQLKGVLKVAQLCLKCGSSE